MLNGFFEHIPCWILLEILNIPLISIHLSSGNPCSGNSVKDDSSGSSFSSLLPSSEDGGDDDDDFKVGAANMFLIGGSNSYCFIGNGIQIGFTL